jgi:Ohr subfamily peroxiredoxin
MGGDDGPGTNPEQLFAAGYSACFLGAIKAVSGKLKIAVPSTASITSKVSFGPYPPGGFNIQVDMAVTLPGLSKADAQTLVDAAHKICPYSNATRNNVDVNISVA